MYWCPHCAHLARQGEGLGLYKAWDVCQCNYDGTENNLWIRHNTELFLCNSPQCADDPLFSHNITLVTAMYWCAALSTVSEVRGEDLALDKACDVCQCNYGQAKNNPYPVMDSYPLKSWFDVHTVQQIHNTWHFFSEISQQTLHSWPVRQGSGGWGVGGGGGGVGGWWWWWWWWGGGVGGYGGGRGGGGVWGWWWLKLIV